MTELPYHNNSSYFVATTHIIDVDADVVGVAVLLLLSVAVVVVVLLLWLQMYSSYSTLS